MLYLFFSFTYTVHAVSRIHEVVQVPTLQVHARPRGNQDIIQRPAGPASEEIVSLELSSRNRCLDRDAVASRSVELQPLSHSPRPVPAAVLTSCNTTAVY
jgi:hypothetical protein